MDKGAREKIKLVSSAGTGHFYTEAGFGFAEESLQLIDYKRDPERA